MFFTYHNTNNEPPEKKKKKVKNWISKEIKYFSKKWLCDGGRGTLLDVRFLEQLIAVFLWLFVSN